MSESALIRYFSLDEARDEIRRRWADAGLRLKVEHFLGDRFISQMKTAPCAIMFRQLLSPDNGAFWFEACSRYCWLKPINLSYHGDKFVNMNEEKIALARLCITHPCLGRSTVSIAQVNGQEGLPLIDVMTRTGEKIVQWHHDLLRRSMLTIETPDITAWYRGVNGPAEYYVHLLAHAIAHGVYFETFDDSPETREASFTSSIVIPAIEKVRAEFGMDPILVRLYPKDQTPEEDFYWFSYPPTITAHIVEWAQQNNLPFKPWKPRR